MDEETEKRLERVKSNCITGYRETTFFRSEKLHEIADRESRSRERQTSDARLRNSNMDMSYQYQTFDSQDEKIAKLIKA